MTIPDRVEYAVGNDRYGRSTRLIGDLQKNGHVYWTIKTDPANQRDEGEVIRSLTTEQLRRISGIVHESRQVS